LPFDITAKPKPIFVYPGGLSVSVSASASVPLCAHFYLDATQYAIRLLLVPPSLYLSPCTTGRPFRYAIHVHTNVRYPETDTDLHPNLHPGPVQLSIVTFLVPMWTFYLGMTGVQRWRSDGIIPVGFSIIADGIRCSANARTHSF
jgi:hypothetical protein